MARIESWCCVCASLCCAALTASCAAAASCCAGVGSARAICAAAAAQRGRTAVAAAVLRWRHGPQQAPASWRSWRRPDTTSRAALFSGSAVVDRDGRRFTGVVSCVRGWQRGAISRGAAATRARMMDATRRDGGRACAGGSPGAACSRLAAAGAGRSAHIGRPDRASICVPDGRRVHGHIIARIHLRRGGADNAATARRKPSRRDDTRIVSNPLRPMGRTINASAAALNLWQRCPRLSKASEFAGEGLRCWRAIRPFSSVRVPPVQVGDDASRLAHQQDACRHVPGR